MTRDRTTAAQRTDVLVPTLAKEGPSLGPSRFMMPLIDGRSVSSSPRIGQRYQSRHRPDTLTHWPGSSPIPRSVSTTAPPRPHSTACPGNSPACRSAARQWRSRVLVPARRNGVLPREAGPLPETTCPEALLGVSRGSTSGGGSGGGQGISAAPEAFPEVGFIAGLSFEDRVNRSSARHFERGVIAPAPGPSASSQSPAPGAPGRTR